eukprot:g668.t1
MILHGVRALRLGHLQHFSTSTSAEAAAAAVTAFRRLDLRVGQITKVWEHEDSDKLFCEEINIGADSRQVVSGLRAHYTLEEMQGRRCVVLCNIKASKLAGIKSDGMVLAAASMDSAQVELLDPPASASIGDRVTLRDTDSGEPLPHEDHASSSQMKKHKLWRQAQSALVVGEDGVAACGNCALVTDAGDSFSVPTLTNVQVS